MLTVTIRDGKMILPSKDECARAVARAAQPETMTEKIRRKGFPLLLSYGTQRDDN